MEVISTLLREYGRIEFSNLESKSRAGSKIIRMTWHQKYHVDLINRLLWFLINNKCKQRDYVKLFSVLLAKF